MFYKKGFKKIKSINKGVPTCQLKVKHTECSIQRAENMGRLVHPLAGHTSQHACPCEGPATLTDTRPTPSKPQALPLCPDLRGSSLLLPSNPKASDNFKLPSDIREPGAMPLPCGRYVHRAAALITGSCSLATGQHESGPPTGSGWDGNQRGHRKPLREADGHWVPLG